MSQNDKVNRLFEACPSYREWPDNDIFLLHTKSFQPFVCKSNKLFNCPNSAELSMLLRRNPEGDAVVDVSCESSSETEFKGDPSVREKVELKLSMILDAFISIREQKPHWIEDTKMKLYLSQCSVFSDSPIEPAQIPFLAPFYSLPQPLLDIQKRIMQINMWMNTSACVSALHYDANHNLLNLVQGAKTVTLLSPAHTHILKAYPAYFTSPNHSKLSIGDLHTCIAQLQHQDHQESDHNSTETINDNTVIVLSAGIFQVTLSEGDVLFIPEGWWHAVESEQCSYAVNYWFQSPCSAFVSDGPAKHMASYLMRAGLHSLIQQDNISASDGNFSSTKKRKLNLENQITDAWTKESFNSLMQQLLESIEKCSDLQSAVHDRLCMDFVNVSFETMAEFWLPFAHTKPGEWTSVLLSLTPPAAHTLLSQWDSLENYSNSQRFKELVTEAEKAFVTNEKRPCNDDVLALFFDLIFFPCGDRIPEVRQYLLTQQSLSFSVAAKTMVSSILNV